MIITQEWLDSIKDEQGVTTGQEYLLNKWICDDDWVGKIIPDHIAKFLKHCKGYRGLPETVKAFKGWT